MQQSTVYRHGHTACLHHLHLAYGEHRWMEGLLRIGTDVLHQRQLRGLMGRCCPREPPTAPLPVKSWGHDTSSCAKPKQCKIRMNTSSDVRFSGC
jgi:hypothetical protein